MWRGFLYPRTMCVYTEILKVNLVKNGYKVLNAFDGDEAVNLALTTQPDLILLDVMLPKQDGFSVCKKVRETMSTPIIMLTARAEEVDKVLGLELGADDYITKPFSLRELMARVKANLRRNTMEATENSESGDSSVLDFGSLKIDVEKYVICFVNNLFYVFLLYFFNNFS